MLVAEDEEALREVTTRILGRGGYTVLAASDGADALKVAAAHDGPIHLLLSDVVMPGMLGRVLAEHLQHARPDTRVLFMSGYAQPVLTSNGILDPGVHLVEKPFTGAILLSSPRWPSNSRRSPLVYGAVHGLRCDRRRGQGWAGSPTAMLLARHGQPRAAARPGHVPQ